MTPGTGPGLGSLESPTNPNPSEAAAFSHSLKGPTLAHGFEGETDKLAQHLPGPMPPSQQTHLLKFKSSAKN